MRFRFDEAAAAFGLFHLAFANLEQKLAESLFFIQQTRNPSVVFDDIRRRGVMELRKDFTKELDRLLALPLISLDAQDLRNTCSRLGALNTWRRDRVHARVRIGEAGIAIFDAKTLKHLPIERGDCVQKIEEAVALAFRLEMHTKGLLQQLDSHKEWQKLFDEIYSTIEFEQA